MNTVRLGDYVKIKTGKLDANASNKDGQYPFFTCSRENLWINKFAYDCECVLVAGNGDLNVKYYSGKFNAYQRTYIIESKNKEVLLTKYLYYFLDIYITVLREQSIGGVIKYIKLANLTDIGFPLPDIQTQVLIVRACEQAGILIAKRQEQIIVLDKLTQDTFIDMFGDPVANPRGWDVKAFSECVSKIENGKSPKCLGASASVDEWGVLKLSAVTKGYYIESENKAAFDSDINHDLEVLSGDLLMTRKNTYELVGRCAYVFSSRSHLMIPDIIFRLITKSNINKIYLWQLMNYEQFRPQVQKLASGSAGSMPNISKDRLMKLKIPVPPTNLQNSFAEIIAKTETQKNLLQVSLAELETTYKSILQKSFSEGLFG